MLVFLRMTGEWGIGESTWKIYSSIHEKYTQNLSKTWNIFRLVEICIGNGLHSQHSQSKGQSGVSDIKLNHKEEEYTGQENDLPPPSSLMPSSSSL